MSASLASHPESECLEFSMRQWGEAARHGVWGGLLEAERAAVREHWLTGVSVVRLLVRGYESRQPAEVEDETHNI